MTFNQSVSACAYTGTVAAPGLGIITLMPTGGDANSVTANVYGSTGAIADRAFYLAVFC